jgi:endonuclease/exonuclease/phosphatase family metal-dependent hydrolase
MRVITYNILRPIWARPGWDVWPRRREAIAAVLRDAAPDYVALQEETPAMVEELLAHLPGYRYLCTAPEPSSGAGLLARKSAPPPGTALRIDLPGHRVANFWPVVDKGRRCWIGSTHFVPFQDENALLARIESARRVIEAFAARPAEPALLMGDFNSLPGDASIRHFLDAGWRDALPPGPDGLPDSLPSALNDTRDGGWRLDYILLSPGWSVTQAHMLTPTPPPSDHQPLFAELHPDDTNPDSKGKSKYV